MNNSERIGPDGLPEGERVFLDPDHWLESSLFSYESLDSNDVAEKCLKLIRKGIYVKEYVFQWLGENKTMVDCNLNSVKELIEKNLK